MSEASGLPPQNTTEQTNHTILADRLAQDMGAIDFGAIANRAGEIIDRGLDAGMLAYSGLRVALAIEGADRARTRIAKIDHKEALYAGIRDRETTGHRNPLPEQPRNRVERFMDRRADKKTFERRVVAAQKKRTEKVFGGAATYVTPKQWGERRQLRQQHRSGNLSAEDFRKQKQSPSVHRVENAEQKRGRKRDSRAQTSLERNLNQPILSRWRAGNRRAALGSFNRHSSRWSRNQNRIDNIWVKHETQRIQREQERTNYRLHA